MAPQATKLVVLAAGRGTRMRRSLATGLTDQQRKIASTGIKGLIPLDRPFLDYVLHRAVVAGLTDVCLVIGPDHDPLREYYAHLVCRRARIEFAVQQEALGTAHAVIAAELFVGSDPFVVVNSDNCYPAAALEQLRLLSGPGTVGFDRDALRELSNLGTERIARFALLECDRNGYLHRIMEKPDVDDVRRTCGPVLVSMNCWRFTPRIFESCHCIDRSPRGELELPDAVSHSMEVLGERYHVVKSDGPVLDLSSSADIAHVQSQLQGEEIAL